MLGNMVLLLLFFFSAASLASYAGLVIHRTRAGLSLLTPRSRCDRCHAPLPLRSLVPVLGVVLTGFRCRRCRGRVPLVWPLFELLAGLAAALPLLLGAAWPIVIRWWLPAFFAGTIAWCDIRTGQVPPALSLPGAAAALLLAIAGGSIPVTDALGGGAGGWLFFFLLRSVTRGGTGLGDADHAGLLGLFLGWRGVTGALISAFLLGGLWAAGQLWRGKAGKKTRVSFTPFLTLGALLTVLTGNWLFRVYGWPL